MLRLHNIYIYSPNDHGYNFMWYERIPNGTKQQSKMTRAYFIAAEKKSSAGLKLCSLSSS